jgi:hypothetical protein
MEQRCVNFFVSSIDLNDYLENDRSHSYFKGIIWSIRSLFTFIARSHSLQFHNNQDIRGNIDVTPDYTVPVFSNAGLHGFNIMFLE